MTENISPPRQNELEALVQKILEKIIQEKGYIYSKDQLATKKDLENLPSKEDLILFFKSTDKRFETLITEMNKRFEKLITEMNSRFQQVDQRFEALINEMHNSFKESDERFKVLVEEMNRRFEDVNKQIEILREDTNRRFQETNEKFEKMINNLQELIKRQDSAFEKLRKDVHSMGSRFGRRLKNIVKELMNRAALEFGVDLYKTERVVLVDEEGVVISPGDVTDIDVYLSNGESYCIEVKSHLDHYDVYSFYKKATILAPKEGIKCSKLMIVALEATNKAREYCDKYKIILVSEYTDQQ